MVDSFSACASPRFKIQCCPKQSERKKKPNRHVAFKEIKTHKNVLNIFNSKKQVNVKKNYEMFYKNLLWEYSHIYGISLTFFAHINTIFSLKKQDVLNAV